MDFVLLQSFSNYIDAYYSGLLAERRYQSRNVNCLADYAIEILPHRSANAAAFYPKLPKAVEKGYLHPICTYRASIALVKA